MRGLIFLALCLVAAVVANPERLARSQRIVGGSETNINQYPFAVALLFSWTGLSYWQACGGTILNNRAMLTAAHCVHGDGVNNWRARVGSTFANSGGTVHNLNRIIVHPNYNSRTENCDIAVLHSASTISGSSGSIAGANYNLGDGQSVWAIGWGTTSSGGSSSETLRHVQVWTVNQATCVARYREIGLTVNDNMLCSGWLDVGGRDQCQGDSGGPLLHNNVVVGVCSWGYGCAHARYPGVNARVSRFSTWIVANA